MTSILIARRRAEVYAYWRDFTHLPRFVERVRNVAAVDALSSIWTVRDANGDWVDWEFIVTDDERDRLIAWASSGHTPVKFSGRVEFEDAAQADTRVTLQVQQPEPPGVLEQLISFTPSTPPLLTAEDLTRLKTVLEAGEPVRVAGTSPVGERAAEQGIGVIAPEAPAGPELGDMP